jgi:hypothetical protein
MLELIVSAKDLSLKVYYVHIEVMRRVEMVPFLPTHYVLKRWSRDANSRAKGLGREDIMETRNSENVECLWLDTLTQKMQRVAIEAVKSHPAYDRACARIIELEEEVTQINQQADLDVDLSISKIQYCHYDSPFRWSTKIFKVY